MSTLSHCCCCCCCQYPLGTPSSCSLRCSQVRSVKGAAAAAAASEAAESRLERPPAPSLHDLQNSAAGQSTSGSCSAHHDTIGQFCQAHTLPPEISTCKVLTGFLKTGHSSNNTPNICPSTPAPYSSAGTSTSQQHPSWCQPHHPWSNQKQYCYKHHSALSLSTVTNQQPGFGVQFADPNGMLMTATTHPPNRC
jgi:hypothetical protein